jgi:hypothetical protein
MEVVGSQRATSRGMEVERVRSEKPTEDSLLWSLRLRPSVDVLFVLSVTDAASVSR